MPEQICLVRDVGSEFDRGSLAGIRSPRNVTFRSVSQKWYRDTQDTSPSSVESGSESSSGSSDECRRPQQHAGSHGRTQEHSERGNGGQSGNQRPDRSDSHKRRREVAGRVAGPRPAPIHPFEKHTTAVGVAGRVAGLRPNRDSPPRKMEDSHEDYFGGGGYRRRASHSSSSMLTCSDDRSTRRSSLCCQL